MNAAPPALVIGIVFATLAAPAAARADDVTSTSPAADDAAVRLSGQRRTGYVMLAGSAPVAALAVWAWSDQDSYSRFMLHGDQGPLIDPSVLVTPWVAPLLAGVGGAAVIRAAAAERGLPPEVPRAHWLGWIPAAVAVGGEVAILVDARRRDFDRPSASARGVVVAGAAASVVYFWGSTIWNVARLPSAPGVEQARRVPRARAWAVAPLVAPGKDPALGVAVAGEL